jgi:hypothetical protein
MNRFSVIYLRKKRYYQLYCATHAEANTVLKQLLTKKGKVPIGIYDAKTELFYWESSRQRQYDQASIEEQGKLDNQITTMAQTLRHYDTSGQDQPNSVAQLLQANPT